MHATLAVMDGHYDTVVIGGGQAGLAVAYALRRTERSFVVLDAEARVGDAWRRRWDSLRLFTPAAVDGLPGAAFPAHRSYRPTKDELADFVEEYAARFDLPVRTSTRVTEVRLAGAGFAVVAGSSSTTARRVVVATGPYTMPALPPFAGALTGEIAQLHSSEYRNPGQLPPGPVLVVGAGNSGGEIASELAATHQVWLSGRDTGHVPFPGDASLYQLFAHVRADRGVGRLVAGRLASRGTPLVRVRPADLAAAGVVRAPRVAGVTEGLPRLADGRALDVAAVIWCTGFRADYGWLPPAATDDTGAPVHDRGVARHVPGLAFAGLRFQTTLASGIVAGAAKDARHVVNRDAPPGER